MGGTSMTEYPRTLLTVEETAERLSIGRTTVFALLKSGELESVQLGRLRRIPAKAVEAYVERLRTGQTEGNR
ncbi:MAG: helix-turn-helix domain-containing protein [Actinophytocola sp.]|nr:helix-turn-helix domain-containing protein [Actinophytocola sp.]